MPLSSRGWARIRRSATVVVFVTATVVGVVLGVQGVNSSPVAPAVAGQTAGVPAPAVVPVAPQLLTPPIADHGGGFGDGRGGRGGGNRGGGQ